MEKENSKGGPEFLRAPREEVGVGPVQMEWELIKESLRAGRLVAMATTVSSERESAPLGATAVWAEGEAAGALRTAGSLGPDALMKFVGGRALALLGEVRSMPPGRAPGTRARTAHLAWPEDRPEVRVLLEVLGPPPMLLVFGAGPDAQPLSRIAAAAGFEVVVVDARPGYAKGERFPDARVICTSPESVPAELLRPHTYAVVMQHHFVRDQAALMRLLDSPVPYVGVLGPRERTARMLRQIGQARRLSEADAARIYSPVGADLGGESPGAIALGIVAEVMALRWGRNVSHLRDRRGPLHPDRLVSGWPDTPEAAGPTAELAEEGAGGSGTPRCDTG